MTTPTNTELPTAADKTQPIVLPVVMFDSTEAATYRTNLSGWVSRDGRFYGEGESAEKAARYDGCTHRACRDCGEPAEKSWLICRQCQDNADRERFDALPAEEWDGVAMLYSETRDAYYSDPDEATDNLDDGMTLADLRLVICVPNRVRELDGDYCHDELPDDGELPDNVEEAMAAFNAAVAGIVLSWSPGKKRLKLD